VAPASRTPAASIALTALASGALAFVGCTGAHYSPGEAPYGYFGGPFHAAFWESFGAGATPAQALFDAKVRYITDMPHGRPDPRSHAIEKKIMRQYSCLGLGW
jgi:hypothetical protein